MQCCLVGTLTGDRWEKRWSEGQSYNSWFWDSGTPRLRDSGTPRLRDSGTPRLRDSQTPGSLRGAEAPGGHLMNMNVNFANNVEMSEDEIELEHERE